MPHRSCTVCGHKDLDAINLALRKGSPPLRALAVQHSVSKTALLRHKAHIDGAAPRVNTTEIDAVDYEIKRIQRALRKAQRSRTRALVVDLSRELRSWITLKAKVQGAIQPEKAAVVAPVTAREAVAMAQAIVEANLNDPAVVEWLMALIQRIQPSEVGDKSGTVEIEHVQDADRRQLQADESVQRIGKPMRYTNRCRSAFALCSRTPSRMARQRVLAGVERRAAMRCQARQVRQVRLERSASVA